MVKEMTKLRKLLKAEGIEWFDGSDVWLDVTRTWFQHRGYSWSVSNGRGTYGGWDFFNKENEGLLELMSGAVNGGDPIGWLTAEEVMDYVRESPETT